MKSNFIEILSQKIEIPIIQRDYAQGRRDSKTNKIRKDFLNVLFDFIQLKANNSNAEIELDFIYGFNEGNDKKRSEFVPIDGQQRLTTLWLLYWFVAVKENIVNQEKLILSNFIYETRHSTTQFCKELIKFSPNFTMSSISFEIKNQSWYFESWEYDPSIQAMLVVLDDIENKYSEFNLNNVWQNISDTSCPFFFYKLDMKKVGLTDDLYIKMNSRGKPLTEFEYFKAGFSELIIDVKQRKRFEQSIDGIWIDTIWHIVIQSGILKNDDDIALTVDNAFLNLFNFITSEIAFKKDIKTADGIRYKDTILTAELLLEIYADINNQLFLFDTLDSICNQQKINPTFWSETFYTEKTGFNAKKTRLFFQHNQVNLLERCLLNYTENRGFTFSEQLLLTSCFTHFSYPQKEFPDRIRIIRNLAANSENELRESNLGNSFIELETYILTGDLNVLKNFKTDQIEEEKQKENFLKNAPNEKESVQRLEDSDLLRGSISLFPFDSDSNTNFSDRVKMFLKLFDEVDFIEEFNQKSNLLLCFGDYSQDDGSLTNLMARNKGYIRGFLTTPGYNKSHLYDKTRKVFMDCLDFFRTNSKISPETKISDTISDYKTNPKDWRYYFLKYDSFRSECNYGYYQWENNEYPIWKMGRKQFNGYYWNPFLHEVFLALQNPELVLENYGHRLLVNCNSDKIWISTLSNGFQFEDTSGIIVNNLITKGELNSNGVLEISRNKEGMDVEDRVEKLKDLITKIL